MENFQVKCGSKKDLQKLMTGEFGLVTDENGEELYIGVNSQNRKIALLSDDGKLPEAQLPVHTHEQHEIEDGAITERKLAENIKVGVRSESQSTGEIFNDYEHNVADGAYSHAEGYSTKASSFASHAEGGYTCADNDYSHVEGNDSTASGRTSHAEGNSTIASGNYSHAEGEGTTASGYCSHAAGDHTIANNYQTVIGAYNSSIAGPSSTYDSAGSLFIVGNGTASTRANAFRVSKDGHCYGRSAFVASGADYAEYFEWIDGNPKNKDRRGLFVALDGDKIRIANANDDYILGVVSANPAVCGDVQSEGWKDVYLKDVFGNRLIQAVNIPEANYEETGKVTQAHNEKRFVINPDYDPTKEYVSRENRKEWAAIGLIGKLVVIDDGTCQCNGYCQVTDYGTATASKEKTAFRVLKRIDGSHIKIFVK